MAIRLFTFRLSTFNLPVLNLSAAKRYVPLFCLAVWLCAWAETGATRAFGQTPEPPAPLPADSTVNLDVGVEVERPEFKVNVTPVDIDRNKPQEPVLHYYDSHGNPLAEPVRFLAELDTVSKPKASPVYPLYNGVSVGVNFFDGILMAFGQRQADFDVWASCSIHNWFFPVVEAGIGFADARPDDGKCHFKAKASPYVRIGLDYNFLYKSNPAYKVYVGLRCGYSHFSYTASHIQPGSIYYEGGGQRTLSGVGCNCFYGQVVAGLQVKIAGPFSMGWSARYSFNLSNKTSNSLPKPWYIPGRGAHPLTATFSAIFNF